MLPWEEFIEAIVEVRDAVSGLLRTRRRWLRLLAALLRAVIDILIGE